MLVLRWGRRGCFRGSDGMRPPERSRGDGGLELTSVRQVTDAFRTFIDGWNDRCAPFVWTKTAQDIPTIASRKAASERDHE